MGSSRRICGLSTGTMAAFISSRQQLGKYPKILIINLEKFIIEHFSVFKICRSICVLSWPQNFVWLVRMCAVLCEGINSPNNFQFSFLSSMWLSWVNTEFLNYYANSQDFQRSKILSHRTKIWSNANDQIRKFVAIDFLLKLCKGEKFWILYKGKPKSE